MRRRGSPDLNDNEYRIQLAGHPCSESVGSRRATGPAGAVPQRCVDGPREREFCMFSRIMTSAADAQSAPAGVTGRVAPFWPVLVLLLLAGVARSWITTSRDGFTIDEAWHAAAGASYAR